MRLTNQEYNLLRNQLSQYYYSLKKTDIKTFVEWSGVDENVILEDIRNKCEMVKEEDIITLHINTGFYDYNLSENVEREVYLDLSGHNVYSIVPGVERERICKQNIGKITTKCLNSMYHNVPGINIAIIYKNKVEEYKQYLREVCAKPCENTKCISINDFISDVELCVTLASGLDELTKTLPRIAEIVQDVKNFCKGEG